MTDRRLFVLPAVLMLLSGCDAASADAQQDPMPIKAQRPAYLATSVGRVDSATEARQLVAAADGVIRHIHVARGARVRAGDVLLSVDCTPRDAAASAQVAQADRLQAVAETVLAGPRAEQIEAARQAVAAAEAGYADAADRLAQARSLATRGFVSRRELTARENALRTSEAGARAEQSRLELLEAGARPSERREATAAARAAHNEARSASALADQCALRSPIAGQVLQILRREGEFSGASQGAPLIVVGDLSRLIVRAEISERDAAVVRTGQAVDIWIEGSAGRWRGRIASLAQVMGRRSARSLDPTDRFDRDVREAFVEIEGRLPPALVGLRVMVGIKA